MTVDVTSLLTAVQLLLLLAAGTLSHGGSCGKRSSGVKPRMEQGSSITLTVMNTVNTSQINQTYSAQTAFSGSLLGAMTRLQDANCSFWFLTTDNIDYGPFLQSVNGVAGKTCDHTYWKLLSESAAGKITTLQLGIGCYIPRQNEHIILRFTKG